MPFFIVIASPFPFTEPVLSGMRFFPFLFVTLSVRVRMTRSEGFRVRVTEWVSWRPFFIVIASEAWQSEEKQNSKIKKQNDRAKMKKQLVISGQQSANY